MKYETVQLGMKKVVGIKGRTSHMDEKMSEMIGGLWNDFYTKGIYQSINHKVSESGIGLYTNYDNKDLGAYDVIISCEVSDFKDQPQDLHFVTIEEGTYAKFIVKGNVKEACIQFWMGLGALNLDRKYGYDFEDYVNCEDMDHAEIHMYISLN